MGVGGRLQKTSVPGVIRWTGVETKGSELGDLVNSGSHPIWISCLLSASSREKQKDIAKTRSQSPRHRPSPLRGTSIWKNKDLIGGKGSLNF